MNANKTFHQANLAKWTAIFQEQKDSGLTVKDWYAQNNVSPHAYYYWKRLAKEAYMDSVLPEIVPIALPATDDNALSEAPQFPAEAHSPDDSRDLYNSRNSYNSPDTLNTKSPVSAI